MAPGRHMIVWVGGAFAALIGAAGFASLMLGVATFRMAFVAAVLVLVVGIWAIRPTALLPFLLVWTVALGLVRRLVTYSILGVPTSIDPLLLIGPLTIILLAVSAAGSGRRLPQTGLSRAVLALAALVCIEALNPLQGGVTAGLAALIFFVPILAFWIGTDARRRSRAPWSAHAARGLRAAGRRVRPVPTELRTAVLGLVVGGGPGLCSAERWRRHPPVLVTVECGGVRDVPRDRRRRVGMDAAIPCGVVPATRVHRRAADRALLRVLTRDRVPARGRDRPGDRRPARDADAECGRGGARGDLPVAGRRVATLAAAVLGRSGDDERPGCARGHGTRGSHELQHDLCSSRVARVCGLAIGIYEPSRPRNIGRHDRRE